MTDFAIIWANAYRNMGTLYCDTGDYTEVLKRLEKRGLLVSHLGDGTPVNKTYSNMG